MRSSLLTVLGMAYDGATRAMRTLLWLVVAAGLVGTVDRAGSIPTKPPAVRTPAFRVGERLTYQAKINFLNAGSATMTVVGIDTVRGRTAYHTSVRLLEG